jgi:hypothetical protein
MTSKRQVLFVFVGFVAGVASAVFAPALLDRIVGKVFPITVERSEEARVTSPDGTVDAVMELFDCGPVCSADYVVSIVPKGATKRDAVQRTLDAEDMVNPRLEWKENHLLEISYDRAYIQSFTNVIYPFGQPGGERESWFYMVEVRLSPTSSGFSYLPPGNDRRTTH